MKCILSIDGGGIRGIIPAVILSEIERRTGEKAYKLFDLITCSSFSAILGSMSVSTNPLGYWGSEIIECWESEIPKIFEKKPYKFSLNKNIFESRFSEENLQEFLHNKLGMSELKTTLSNLLIPTFDLKLQEPYLFKTNKANEKLENNFYLHEVCQASCAKPTYFTPFKVKDRILIDGSLYANNPSLCGLTEAIKLMPFRGYFLVSMGCGLSSPQSPEDIDKDNMFHSYDDIVAAANRGIERTVHYQAQQILSNYTYYRLQPNLQKYYNPTDASKESIEELKKAAYLFCEENARILDKIAEVVTNRSIT